MKTHIIPCNYRRETGFPDEYTHSIIFFRHYPSYLSLGSPGSRLWNKDWSACNLIWRRSKEHRRGVGSEPGKARSPEKGYIIQQVTLWASEAPSCWATLEDNVTPDPELRPQWGKLEYLISSSQHYHLRATPRNINVLAFLAAHTWAERSPEVKGADVCRRKPWAWTVKGVPRDMGGAVTTSASLAKLEYF